MMIQIRHRAVRSKGCLSNKTALAMTFKLAEAAESRRLIPSSASQPRQRFKRLLVRGFKPNAVDNSLGV